MDQIYKTCERANHFGIGC